MVRFIAVALGAFDTGISAIKPNIDAVARTLGRTSGRMLRRDPPAAPAAPACSPRC
jgi:ABC-type Fe3+ transport system permease subunit